jgi:hypothetical protein
VFSQNINLTATTGTFAAGYVDFTTAFAAINAGTHGGAVVITVNSSFTDNNATLNAPPAVGTPYTSVRIQVNPAVVANVIVQGGNNTPVLNLNRAKNVTIDGNVGGVRRLVIVNTNTTAPITLSTALELTNDAQNITINNTQFASGVQSTTRGTITFISGSTADLHTVSIRNCQIYDAGSTTAGGGFPSCGIIAVDGGNKFIRDITISDNLIYNYHSATTIYAVTEGPTGIFLVGDTYAWTIQNNRLFQTASRSYAYNTTTSAIRLGTGYGYRVEGNTIGYGNLASLTGNYTLTSTTNELRFVGIWAYSQATTDSTNITGNTIRNFAFTTRSNKNGEVSNNPRGVWCGISVSDPTGETVTIQVGRIGIHNNTIGDLSDNTAPYSIQSTTYVTNSSLVGIYVNHQGTYMTISNNNIASMATLTNTNNQSHFIFGIDARGDGDKNITGNTLQYLYSGNILDNNDGSSHIDGMLVFGNGVHYIANNSFLDMISYGSRNGYVSGMLYAVAGRNIVMNNQIRNIEVRGRGITSVDPTFAYGFAGRSATLFGMRVAGTGEQIVGNNTISDIRGNIRASVAAADLGVAAVGLGGNNVVGRVFGNTIYNIQLNQGLATSLTTSGTAGIIVNNAVSSWDVYNNMVSLFPTNNIAVLGIASDGLNHTVRFLSNSVYIGGGLAGGTESSGCLYRADNATITMRNNLLYNERIAGGLANFCVLFRSNGGTINSDYNTYLPRSGTSTVALLQSTTPPAAPAAADVCANLAALKAKNVNFDRFSWSHQQANVPEVTNLFIDPTVGNLHINTTNAAAWYSSGKGEQNTLVSQDIDGNARSTTVFAGTTDIGADEFDLNRTTNPAPQAVQTGAIAASATTTYTWADKKIGEITWGTGGTLPTSMNFRYFSGETPNNPTGLNAEYQNGYWLVEPLVGTFSGTDYSIQFDFGVHETGTVAAPSANIILAKRDANWVFYKHSNALTALRSTRDYASTPKTMRVPTLTNFSDFALTSELFPLPVEWLSFSGKLVDNQAVLLEWRTISEINHNYFEVERMNMFTQKFEKIKNVYLPISTTSIEKKYHSLDKEPQIGSNYYRIKQVDLDGTYSYSNVVEVTYMSNSNQITLLPNPTTDKTITIAIPQLQNNQIADLEIYNATGKKCFSQSLIQQNTKLFLPHLAKGMYLVVVRLNQQQITKKLIVE